MTEGDQAIVDAVYQQTQDLRIEFDLIKEHIQTTSDYITFTVHTQVAALILFIFLFGYILWRRRNK